MKKARILTLHFYDNYGSVLQAWALRRCLQGLGYDAEIIPFRPPLPEHEYFSEPMLKEKYRGRRERFAAFRGERLGMPGTDGGEEVLRKAEGDAFIVGSDIVWSREFAGLHPAYFLDFVPEGAKRISYAASMKLAEADCALIRRCLPRFDAVSVREANDAEIVSRIAGIAVKTVVDPTLLIQPGEYAPLETVPANLPEEPYLLYYGLTHDPAAADTANLLAKRFGLRLVHFLADAPAAVFPKDALCFAFSGPGEFLSWVKNASMVFTDSYHGTIFSVIYRRPFYTRVTRGGMSARAMGLTGALGLESRRYGGWDELLKTAPDIDWKEPLKRIRTLREESLKFLTDALEEQNV